MTYHTFVSYNRRSLDQVNVLVEYLEGSGLRVFFDQRDILPGSKLDQIIDQVLKQTPTITVVVGPQGLGPWQTEEYATTRWQVVNDSDKKLIPVLLPGASLHHDAVPLSLRTYSAVMPAAAPATTPTTSASGATTSPASTSRKERWRSPSNIEIGRTTG